MDTLLTESMIFFRTAGKFRRDGTQLECLGYHAPFCRSGSALYPNQKRFAWLPIDIIDISDREIGGPGRDRTGDLFHAMEVENLPAIDSKGAYDRRNGLKPYYSAQFATKLLPKNDKRVCG